MFGATQKAFAGNDLYYTGSDSSDTVAMKYQCHAKLFNTREEAEKAVAPWNNLGHKFAVREIPVEYRPGPGGEGKYVDGVFVGYTCG